MHLSRLPKDTPVATLQHILGNGLLYICFVWRGLMDKEQCFPSVDKLNEIESSLTEILQAIRTYKESLRRPRGQ